MKSETEDETNLFLAPRPAREKHTTANADDDWDDTQLIKAYDKAVSKAKRQILKRLQVELNLTESDIQEAFSDVSISKKKKKKRKKSKSVKREWKVQDVCRAIYLEDGQEYEAEIVSIIDSQRCIIKFIGYGNEQEELLENLMSSLGENVIEFQIESAEAYNSALNNENEVPAVESEPQEPFRYNRSRQEEHLKRNRSKTKLPQRPPMFNPDRSPSPPAPPMPPFDHEFVPQYTSDHMRAGMFPNQMFPPMSRVAAQSMESEDLNSLLTAWYMCGYYTGYFHRGRQNK